ncbi:MAG: HIT family protein [bacterium]|nr:HIT family protein [bacterium]MDT8394934.1 HIT family protein [bacterium]
MTDNKCPFCSISPDRIVLQNDHAVVIRDGFPVSEGHTLIIPKRHISSWFETHAIEKAAILHAMDEAKQQLDEQHAPDGYNMGINDGQAAGQTVLHLHVHLIPRYRGDSADPRGGVRWIRPDKAKYWD